MKTPPRFFLEPIEHPSLEGFDIYTKYKNHKRRHVGNILKFEDDRYGISFNSPVIPTRIREGHDSDFKESDRSVWLEFSNMEVAKSVVSSLLHIQINS